MPEAGADDPDRYIGSGWAFPPFFDRNSCTATTVSGADDIRESLFILFKTALGERVLAPDYGSELNNLVFEALDETTLGEIQHVVSRAIQQGEPRIWLEQVSALRNDAERTRVDVRVEYIIRHTNSRASMVFPFYLSEGTQL